MQPAYVKAFVTFLRSHKWHRNLLQAQTVLLDSKYTDTDLDNFLMAITKVTETSLRDSIQRHQGSSMRSEKVGVRLLDSAVHCHLIDSKQKPIYAMLYWILKEPRNLHHHEFRFHPLKNLMLFVLQIDHALLQLDELLRSNYRANYKVKVDDTSKEIIVYEATVFDLDGEDITSDVKLDAYVTFSDDKVGEIPLNDNGSGYKYGSYNYRGNAAGTISVELGGVSSLGRFAVSSGSTCFVLSEKKECPNCGSKTTGVDWRCDSCGHHFYVI